MGKQDFNPVTIIEKKRDGHVLTCDEIEWFFWEYTAGNIPDYQASALCMAIYFQDMNVEETSALTLAMAASGEQLDLLNLFPPGKVIVDKHSSGGVGDKTTLAVAPIAAALGLPVGKMTGRGLSFSGGTIDKLESISGWSAGVSDEQFRRQLRDIGIVIAGQTHQLAPADGKLYALRDVIGAVPSLPLIASSIMSKKIATGADAIALDVKSGKGAFMSSVEEAKGLAELMVGIGKEVGRKMSALITNMDQPLGFAVGNALEVKEAIETLKGNPPPDFYELVRAVVAELLWLSGESPDESVSEGYAAPAPEVVERIEQVIASGKALDKFRLMVEAQGGDPEQIEHPDKLPKAPVVKPLLAGYTGWIDAIDAREVGLTCAELGGGRRNKEDTIDPRVGIVFRSKVGHQVENNDPILEVHAADENAAEQALRRLGASIGISESPIEQPPVIHYRYR